MGLNTNSGISMVSALNGITFIIFMKRQEVR